MHFPAIDDTIVAVATAWSPSAVGVIRLSGRDAFEHAARIGADLPAGARFPALSHATLNLGEPDRLPATIFWFRAPRSYTGQDCAEIHTAGCLPLLRLLAARLIEQGARRALPGEFTARAYLNGRMDPRAVDGVLRLLHAGDQAEARAAARAVRGETGAAAQALRERILDLLARVEAGIDFVEEEDIRFISDAELEAECRSIESELRALVLVRQRELAANSRPHVALVGLPNAGKSTLFNALLGRERAIVSPVVGTTRDVLSAEVELLGVSLVLQDCAGLSAAETDIDAAAHIAAESASQQADLVLWTHDVTTPIAAEEAALRNRIGLDRQLLVLTKSDSITPPGIAPPAGLGGLVVSAATGAGLVALRQAIVGRVSDLAAGNVNVDYSTERALAAMSGATRAAAGRADSELVALDLRESARSLGSPGDGTTTERVLGRIFTQFCVGK